VSCLFSECEIELFGIRIVAMGGEQIIMIKIKTVLILNILSMTLLANVAPKI
jgi:hypothetical protein